MASYCEPMEVDEVEPDDKENAFRPNGAESASALAGGEDLDVSELNMKLRLSCTPMASPAPSRRTFTGSCKNLFPESGDSEALNSTVSSGSTNMTLTEFSMGDYNGNSPLSQNSTRSTIQSQEDDQNKNETVLYQSSDDSAILSDCTLNNSPKKSVEPNDTIELLLTPSAPISITPGDKSPTKAITKNSTSPIMRGLKSVLSMFRQSQSPVTSEFDIIPASEDINSNQDLISPNTSNLNISLSKSVIASTPVHGDEELKKSVEHISLKGSSTHIPESIVFNDDLINDLQWNDDTTITFNKNKLPGRKLCTPSLRESNSSFGSCSRESIPSTEILRDDLIYSQDKIPELALTSKVNDTTVEYMDISINDSHSYCNEVGKSENHKAGSLHKTSQIDSETETFLESFHKSVQNSVQETSPTVIYQTEIVGTYDNNGNESQLADNTTNLDKNLAITDTTYLSKQSSCNNTIDCNTFIEKEVLNSDHNNMSLSQHTICISENFTLPLEKSTTHIEEIKNDNNLSVSTKNKTEVNVSIDGITSDIVENKLEINNSVGSENISIQSNIVTIPDHEVDIINEKSSKLAELIPNKGEIFSEEIVYVSKLAASTKNTTEKEFSIHGITTTIVENEIKMDHTDNVMASMKNVNPLVCGETISSLSNIAKIHQQEHNIISEGYPLSSELLKNTREMISINDKAIIFESTEGINMEVVPETIKTGYKDVTENATNILELDDNSCKKVRNICEDEEMITSETNSPYVSLNAPIDPESIDELPKTEVLEIDFNAIENPFITKSQVSVTPPLSEKHNDIGNICLTSSTVHLCPIASNKTFQEDMNLEPLSKFIYDSKSDSDKIQSGVTVDASDKNLIDVTFEANDNKSSSIGLLSSILNGETKHDCSVNFETLVQKDTVDTEKHHNQVEITTNLYNVATGTNINLLSQSESNIENNIDSQDQSDAYLSADSSGRESEQLLENELEIIDKSGKIVSEHKPKLENITITKFGDADKARSITGLSDTLYCSEYVKFPECDKDSIKHEFKTNPIISHALEDNPSLKIVIEKSFEITANTEVPSIPAELPDVQFDNPFITRTKIRMSPPLLHNSYTCGIKEPSEALDETEIALKSECYSSRNCDDSLTTHAFGSPLLATNDTSKSGKINLAPESNIGILVNAPPEEADIKEVPLLRIVNIPDTVESLHNLSQYDNCTNIGKQPLADVNPFATKSKIMTSPPNNPDCRTKNENISDCLDPFLTKSKIRMSPTLSQDFNFFPEKDSVTNQLQNLVVTENKLLDQDSCSLNTPKDVQNVVEMNTTFDLTENPPQSITMSDFVINNKNQDKSDIESPIKSGCVNDETICSGSSIVSGNADQTTIEVKTEDEDTMEGPDFVDEPNNDKTFENYSQMESERTGPKVILCSDEPDPLSNGFDDIEQEFVDCTDEKFNPGELFINADTFDYLMNQNATSNETNDNGKESLFLKFDPLCANKRKSPGIVELVNPECGLDEGTSHTEIINEERACFVPASTDEKSPQTYSHTKENVNNAGEQLFVSACSTPPEKPVMAVMPAVYNEQAITPRSATYTPTRPERRSIIFPSPAIAAIDRLISLSGNNSPLNQTYNENYAPSQESNEAIIELRHLLAEKELQVEQLRTEARGLQERLADFEAQMTSLQEENDDRLVKLNSLQAKLAQKSALNHDMAAVVEEYERVIAGMNGENEQERQQHEQERAMLVRERDEQVAHLNSMEVSFSDLHTKYERTKQVISTYKANEDALRKTIEKYKDTQQKLEKNCETLKQQATSKINSVNMEIEKLKKGHESEVLKLTALVKRKEMHAASLEETLAQKVKANEELTAICDELISKVG